MSSEAPEPIELRPSRPLVELRLAQLCVDCEAIYETDPGTGCPRCGSRSALALARVISPADEPAPWRRP